MVGSVLALTCTVATSFSVVVMVLLLARRLRAGILEGAAGLLLLQLLERRFNELDSLICRPSQLLPC